MAGHDMDAPQSSSRQSLDEEVPQPPSPALMRFPSAVSTPVSPLDLIAMEELRKKARAGGADRPGRYGETHVTHENLRMFMRLAISRHISAAGLLTREA